MRDGQKTRFARRLRRNMTPAERLLWWKLKEKQQGWKFLRQTPVGPFVLDFACLEVLLAIEVDGATHRTKKESTTARPGRAISKAMAGASCGSGTGRYSKT